MMLLWLISKKIKNKRNGVLNPFFYIINCKINPEVTPIKYINAEIIRFCFIFLLVLNNTINPTPAPVSNPATKEAIFITFSIYKLVIITDAAQFGISPIKLDTIGPKKILFFIIISILSSPTAQIITFIINVIIKIYIVIFIV